jgi:hypothetical protein
MERFAMNIRVSLAFVIPLLALGCSSQPQTTNDTTAPAATVTVPPSETAEVPAADPKPSETAQPTPTPEETPGDKGRVAFQGCSEESRKTKGCTKELKPVCGEVDTGIRCIRAPCPSSVQKTFSNPCLACTEAKVTGYWPMACENMTKQPEPGAPVQ